MLKAQVKDQKGSGLLDFLLVDLRRVDREVQHIFPSLTLWYLGARLAGVTVITPNLTLINRAAPFAGLSTCRRRAYTRLSRRFIPS